MKHRDRTLLDRLEAQLRGEFRRVLYDHPILRRLSFEKREEIARASVWGAIQTLTPEDVDFAHTEPSEGA